MKELKIYVLNASGGEFPVQLAFLSEIYKAKKNIKKKFNGYHDYGPDLVLCCSGGNVAAYLAMSADWSPSGIDQICRYMDSKMFLASWLPFLPTYIASLFTGSVYRHGYGVKPIFRTMYNPVNIQKSEIWTGTFDTCNGREQLFCNKSEKTALIKKLECKSAYSLFNIMPYTYLNGNVDKIAEVSAASASVPFLTQSRQIDENKYADGCIMYASTLIPLAPQIREIVYQNDYKLQLIYFCSYNMEKSIGDGGVLSLAQPIRALIHSSTLKDRNSAVELLRSLDNDIEYEHHCKINTEKLTEVVEEAECRKHFVIFIYPNCDHGVDMTNFCYDDIIKVMDETKKSYSIHIWQSRC